MMAGGKQTFLVILWQARGPNVKAQMDSRRGLVNVLTARALRPNRRDFQLIIRDRDVSGDNNHERGCHAVR
ncbi:hypothetical protein SDC9_138006 [bioreactor metagenome]|uniref:Uncharacterized protein n=1 Tax=bioreactor metagenome TaxID=1076179 RepID=A0A645DQ23_9ZZZZ